jgi:hypothetical protein
MGGDLAMRGLLGVTQLPPLFLTHQENNCHNIPHTEKYYKRELREKRITFMAETLVLFSLTVSVIITQNGKKTPPAEFGSYANIKFKKCHFPSLCNVAH